MILRNLMLLQIQVRGYISDNLPPAQREISEINHVLVAEYLQ